MKELKLTYKGMDSWNRPVYEDENGKIWKDTDPRKGRNPRLCSAYRNEFDGELDMPMDVLKAYEDVKIVFVPERVVW